MSKVLRVGIIEGGKIIEERRLPSRGAVSIGSGPGATFQVASLPFQVEPLFELEAGRYRLRVRPGMTGRVQRGDGTAVDVRGSGAAIALDDASRGKVVIGELTVLFQLVDAPATTAVEQLPKELRRAWTDVDPQFASLVLGSLMLCFSVAAYARSEPYVEPTLEELVRDRDWTRIDIANLPLPLEEPSPSPPLSPSRAPGTDHDHPAPRPGPAVPRPPPGRLVIGPRDVGKTGVLVVIGSALGGKPGGAVRDLFSPGLDEGSIAKALGDAQSIALADGEVHDSARHGGGGGGPLTIADLATDVRGALRIGPGEKTAEAAPGGGTTRLPEVPRTTGSLSPEVIAHEVKARLKSIKSCYDAQLKRFPKLAGKLVISLTIDDAGKVVEVAFPDDTLNNRAVTECITERIMRWRFPEPPTRGADVSAEFPVVFEPGD
jgi:hypothetical protein